MTTRSSAIRAIFRRLEVPVAVEIRSAGGSSANEAAQMLDRSPRFEQRRGGLGLSVRLSGASASACLSGQQAQLIACAQIDITHKPAGRSIAAYVAQETLRQLFAPRIDLSQTEINSLDGQNLTSRDALKTLFE